MSTITLRCCCHTALLLVQAAVQASSEAQASLAASLQAMRATLESQAAASKARERELYLKVCDLDTMTAALCGFHSRRPQRCHTHVALPALRACCGQRVCSLRSP